MLSDLKLDLPMVKYVDDTTVYDVCSVGSQDSLQQALDELTNWSKDNDMQINPKKTKEMVINFTKEVLTHPLSIADETLECVEETKLLGLWINNRLKWDTHIDEIHAKAARRLYLLVYTITKSRSFQ